MTYNESILHQQVDVLKVDVEDLFQRIRELEEIVEILYKHYETTQN